MTRLATGIWIAAYRRRLEAEGIAVMVTARGDETAGAVLVKLCTMDGRAQVFQRQVDLMSGDRRWAVLSEGAEAECDASIKAQRGFDPDLWVLEVEDPKGRHGLDWPGLEG